VLGISCQVLVWGPAATKGVRLPLSAYCLQPTAYCPKATVCASPRQGAPTQAAQISAHWRWSSVNKYSGQVLKNAATAGHTLLTVNDLLSENHRDGKPANSRR